MPLPDERAFHVERHELAGGEHRVDHGAVADGARQRHVGLVMRRRQRRGCFHAVLPETLSTLAIERLHQEDRLRRGLRGGAGLADAPLAKPLGPGALRETGPLLAGPFAGLRRDDHEVADDDG